MPSRNIPCLQLFCLFTLFHSGSALQLPLTLMIWTLLQIPGQLFCRTVFEIVRFLHAQAVMGRGGADQAVIQRPGVCLGWLRRTSDQPHQPPYIVPDLARPHAFWGCLPCWGFTLVSLRCLASCSIHPAAMVHAFLIHTLRAPQAEDAGLCRVLYSCVFGAENSPDDPRPHGAERDRLLCKEQILAVAR